MKIVTTSNFALDSFAEQEVALHIRNMVYADAMIKGLHALVHDGDPTWFKLVGDEYKCWRGMAEFADDTEERNRFLDEEIGLL